MVGREEMSARWGTVGSVLDREREDRSNVRDKVVRRRVTECHGGPGCDG